MLYFSIFFLGILLIPLQVEHVAVEFIVEPFRPSGPCLRTMKIYECHVDTSYFTHNWETRGGRERIGPKDRPTALITGQACPAYLALAGFDSELSFS